MRLIPAGVCLLGVVRLSRAVALITPPLSVPTAGPVLLQRATTAFSTCGYVDGDPSRPRIAPQGFNCRVDTVNGLWGFCPTSVLAASDCGLGGFCFDGGSCSTGCGRSSLRNNPKITTWTCPEFDDAPSARFCTTESLIFGPDQTFDYVDCAANPGKQILFFSPTTAAPQSSASGSVPSSPASLTAPTPTSTPPIAPAPNETTSILIPPAGSPAPGTEHENKGTNSSNTGVIIGGTLGGLALILGFGLATVYLLRHRWARRSGTVDEPVVATRVQDNPTSSDDGIKEKPTMSWQPRELPGVRPPGELAAYNPDGMRGQFAELPAEYR